MELYASRRHIGPPCIYGFKEVNWFTILIESMNLLE